MTGTTLYKTFLAILVGSIAFSSMAQTTDIAPVKKYRFTFYAGVGPNFYLNNLVLAKDKVNEFNYSFVGRIMWEPAHNLSLGIESGYNRLYSVSAELPPPHGSVHIVNVAIPIQIVVSMKFFKNYYANFSMGQSILLNKVNTTENGSFNATTVSLGDFGATIGYRRLVNDRIYIGAEIKGYYSSKLQDRNIALVFLGGFRL
jgi:hypothetical protein